MGTSLLFGTTRATPPMPPPCCPVYGVEMLRDVHNISNNNIIRIAPWLMDNAATAAVRTHRQAMPRELPPVCQVLGGRRGGSQQHQGMQQGGEGPSR